MRLISARFNTLGFSPAQSGRVVSLVTPLYGVTHRAALCASVLPPASRTTQREEPGDRPHRTSSNAYSFHAPVLRGWMLGLADDQPVSDRWVVGFDQ